MQLNLPILFDALAPFSPSLASSVRDDFYLELVRQAEQAPEIVLHNTVYLVSAAAVTNLPQRWRGASLVVLGEISPEFAAHHELQMIVLPGAPEREAVFARLQEVFLRYANWLQQVLYAIAKREPLQAVFDIAGSVLDNPIALFDISQTLLMKTGRLPADMRGSVWEAVLEKGYSLVEEVPAAKQAEIAHRLMTSNQPFLMKDTPGYWDQQLVVSLKAHGEPFATLGATDIRAPFTPGQISLVEKVKELMELAFANNREANSSEEDVTYFVDRLLRGLVVEERVLTFHLNRQKWGVHDNYYLFDFSRPKSADLSNPLSRMYLMRLRELMRDAIVISYENGIVAICHQGRFDYGGEAFRSRLRTLLASIDLNCGVSSRFSDFRDLKYAYIQSKAALQESEDRGRANDIFSFDAFYQDHVFHSLEKVTSLKSLCYPKVLEMKKSGGKRAQSYLQCLRTYLILGRNLSATAQRLDLHRNTLAYRLKRISEILELDLDEAGEATLFRIYFSCLIADYL